MTAALWNQLLRFLAVAVLVALVVAQAVPYGRDHGNPPVASEPTWDHPATRELAERACFDCHSNQTRWPWYSRVAPASWWLQREVDQGRRALNFSAWTGGYADVHDATTSMLDGRMPPRSYLLTHPEARLTAADRDRLVRGLDASLER